MLDKIIPPFLFLIVVLWLVDMFAGNTKQYTGTVIDMAYVPGSTEHTTGTAYSAQSSGTGGVTTYSSTTRKPDQWTIIVRRSDGRVVSVDSDASIYYTKKPGNTITFETYYGLITNIAYGNEATK